MSQQDWRLHPLKPLFPGAVLSTFVWLTSCFPGAQGWLCTMHFLLKHSNFFSLSAIGKWRLTTNAHVMSSRGTLTPIFLHQITASLMQSQHLCLQRHSASCFLFRFSHHVGVLAVLEGFPLTKRDLHLGLLSAVSHSDSKLLWLFSVWTQLLAGEASWGFSLFGDEICQHGCCILSSVIHLSASIMSTLMVMEDTTNHISLISHTHQH